MEQDIFDLFAQNTAAPAVPVNPADAEREARLKQLLGMQPEEFEDAAFKRFWKKQYGVDDNSSGVKRFLAGLAEGGSKLAQGKERPLVMDRAHKEGLEDYTAAQRSGLAELKLLDGEQKQQNALAQSGHFKALAAQEKLGRLALQMAQRGDAKELIDAKIVQLGKQGGLTDAQIAKVQADTAFTKTKDKNYETSLLDPASRTAALLQGDPRKNAIESDALRTIFQRGAAQQGAKSLFGGAGSSGAGSTTATTTRDTIIEDPVRGKIKVPLTSTTSRQSSGGGGRNPQQTMQLLQQALPGLLGGNITPPEGGPNPAAPATTPQPIVPPTAAPQQLGVTAANRPPNGGVRPLVQQATAQSNKTAWREKAPFLVDAYKNLVPGFNEGDWEPPPAYAAGIGFTPKNMADPKRIAGQEAVAGFRNLAATAAKGFLNDKLKDAVGPMSQLKNTIAKYGKGRPDLAIATSTMSGKALADMVRSISGLTVSDAEQRRLEGLVANANTSPQEFVKMAMYVNMMQQRGEIANSLNLGPELSKYVLGDPELGEKLYDAWRKSVSNLEIINKLKKSGATSFSYQKDGKKYNRSIADYAKTYDPDKKFREIIWETLQAKFPDSPFLPRKVAK